MFSHDVTRCRLLERFFRGARLSSRNYISVLCLVTLVAHLVYQTRRKPIFRVSKIVIIIIIIVIKKMYHASLGDS